MFIFFLPAYKHSNAEKLCIDFSCFKTLRYCNYPAYKFTLKCQIELKMKRLYMYPLEARFSPYQEGLDGV